MFCFVKFFLLHASSFLPFSPLSSMAVCTISSRFLHLMHFQYIFPIVLPVSFSFRSFLHHFLWLLSHFPALSLYSSSMFTASSWFAPSIRSGFLHFPRDFPWFVPSIRSVFVRFPGDFVRFPLIVVMFSGPPSANYLVVHNPAKCSVFSRSTQGHGEISFPFGNHPRHTPYSHFVRKQQLAS